MASNAAVAVGVAGGGRGCETRGSTTAGAGVDSVLSVASANHVVDGRRPRWSAVSASEARPEAHGLGLLRRNVAECGGDHGVEVQSITISKPHGVVHGGR